MRRQYDLVSIYTSFKIDHPAVRYQNREYIYRVHPGLPYSIGVLFDIYLQVPIMLTAVGQNTIRSINLGRVNVREKNPERIINAFNRSTQAVTSDTNIIKSVYRAQASTRREIIRYRTAANVHTFRHAPQKQHQRHNA